MNLMSSKRSPAALERAAPKVGRRGLVVGAGVAAAAALAAAALHRGTMQLDPRAGPPKGEPEPDAAYRLTPHVQRYYESAKG